MKLKINNNDITIKKEDCLQFLKSIKCKSIDLIIIDPPYYKKMIKDWKNNKIDWDSKWTNIDKYANWCEGWLKECKRVLKDNGSLYIFSDSINQAYLQIRADKYFKLKNVIYWVKQNSLQRKGWNNKYSYSPITENILFYSNMYTIKDVDFKFKISTYLENWVNEEKIVRKNLSMLFPSKTGGLTGCVSNWIKGLNLITKKQYIKIQNWAIKNNKKGLKRDWDSFVTCFNQKKDYTNVWNGNMTQSHEKTYGHPTQKPLYILETIIKTSSRKNSLILDFFLGSGSTMIASNKNNRNFIGCELNNDYIKICEKRINEDLNR